MKTYMRKNWKERLVSGLLSLTMALSLLPAGVLTLPAQAAEITTGKLDALAKDNPTTTITFTGTGGTSGNAVGNYCVVLVPDLSSDSGGVPSNKVVNLLANMNNPTYLRTRLTQYGIPWETVGVTQDSGTDPKTYGSGGSIVFNNIQIAKKFEDAKAALHGLYKADGTPFDKDTDTVIPMIALIYTGAGFRAYATADWSGVALAELVPTTSPLKAVLDDDGLANVEDIIKNVGKGDSAISNISVTMDGDSIAAWFDTYDYTLADIAAGGQGTGTLDLALKSAMADNFTSANLTITITYNGGSKSPLQIPVTVTKATDVTATEELIFTGKVTYDESGNFTGLTFNDASKNVTLTPGDAGQYVLGDSVSGSLDNVTKIDNDLGWDVSSIRDYVYQVDVVETQYEMGYINVTEEKFFPIVPPGSGSQLESDLKNGKAIATTTDYVSYLKISVAKGDVDNGVESPTELIVRLIARITPDFAKPETKYNYTFKFKAPTNSTATSATNMPTAGQTTGSVSYPTAPTLTGYTFKGWGSVTAGGSAPTTADWTSGAKTISEDTDFYAIWEPYKITFNPQSGKFSDNATTNKAFDTVDGKLSAANVTAVSNPTRTGYTFDGWYTAATGGTKLTDLSASKVFSASATYYAHWTGLEIKFDPNGGKFSDNGTTTKTFTTTDKKLTSAQWNSVATPTHTNTKKIFRGWSTSTSADDIVSLNANTEYTTAQTYTAIWGDLYTITYKADDKTSGTVPNAQTQTSYGEALTVAGGGDLKKTGYVFAGWSYDNKTYGPNNNKTLAPTSDVTLVATWAKTYSVIYNENAASGVSGMPSNDDKSGVGYLPGEKTSVSSTKPTRSGYTFLGWNTDKDANSATYTGGKELTFEAANINLFAIWSELPAISGATATDASKFEFGGTVTLKDITLTSGDPLGASDVGATKKVPVAKWYVGNGGNTTTGPSRKTELAAGPASSCNIPAASAGTVFENDDIWVYLEGNGTNIKTDGKWVKLGTIGAKSAALTITPLYVPVSGNATTTNPTDTNPGTVGGGSYKANVDINVSTSYTGQDLTFYGWSTKSDGTLVNTVGSGSSVKTLIKSPVANTNNGSATVNMNTNADGDLVATTVYAVYKVIPTLSFTVEKANGADIDSVKVTRSRGNVGITLGTNGGFGTYTDKVQVGDTVIVTSTAGTNSDPDGFDISGTADGDDPDYQLVTTSKSSIVVKLLKTGVTITAKSKAKPPRLNLEPTAGAGTLDGSTFTHNTNAEVTVSNLGGSSATRVSAAITDNDMKALFAISTALDTTIASEDSSTLTIVPKNGVTFTAQTYSIPVTVTYEDAEGKSYEATTMVTYVVSNATTYTGQVIVNLDGNPVAANAATVALDAVNTTAVATANGGKVVYDGSTNRAKLTKGTAYTITVVHGGRTYTANDKLSDSSTKVDGIPTVTVDLYTVTLVAPNLSANQAALESGNNNKYITLTLPKEGSSDNTNTKNVTYANLSNTANNRVSRVYQKGTTVTATAGGTLNSGHTFDKWTSDASGNTLVNSTASYKFTVDAATTLHAVMKKSETAVVTYLGNYDKAPNVDTGRSYPIGVPASQIVSLGAGVTLNTAVPKLPGYKFKGWSTVPTRTAAQWNKTTNAGRDFAPGDSIAALNSTVAGFDTTNKSLTLYAIWEDATLTASNATGAAGTYGSYYGATPNFQVKLNNANTTEKLNYALGTVKLPGGLGLNANTGEVYGTPYQVVNGRAANVTITLAEDYHDASHKRKAEVTYTMTVGKATPTITGVAISGATEGAAITTATYTVTVVGPRLKSDNGTNADTINNPADDVWETYTDTIKIAASTKTSGIGDSTISGGTDGKFVTGGDTTINATFEAAAKGIPASGALGDASKDFDACSGNKQNTVWKDTAEDANIKGTATFTPNTTYSMAVRLGNENQDSNYATSKNWNYKAADGSHAHKGYNTSTGSGTDGVVTIGSGSTADSVTAKQFSLKNTGTGGLTNVTFTFGKGANSPFAIATAASLTDKKLPAGSTGNPVNFTVKVNAAKAADKGTYQDTLTITSTEGNSVVIYLSFTVDEATTYKAQITTKFQTVANAYAATPVAAAAAKIGAANTNSNAVVTLKPVGTGSNVVINSSTTYDVTNKCYEVDLVSGKDYQIVVSGGGTGIAAYTLPRVTVTANNHTAEVTMRQVELKQHFKDSSSHTDLTSASKSNTSGSVSGAGWYVDGQSASISTFTSFTANSTAYTFVEWFSGKEASDTACTADGAGGTNTSFSAPITVAKSFNAHYKVQDAATVKLTYDKNTTDDVLVPPAATATKSSSGHFTISSSKPSRTGYIFDGWASAVKGDGTKADGATVYQPGNQGPSTANDATVYALWTKIKIGHTGDGNWMVTPPDGTYGVDYSYTIPGITVNAGKVTYELSATTDGNASHTTVDGKTITTTLPGGLYLDAATGLIHGKPYEVIEDKGPYVLKVVHELGDGVVEPLYSAPFYITVDKYQLQLTNTSVTGAVAGQGADTATYTATVVDAPIYKGKTDGKDVWGVIGGTGGTAPFTETVTRTNGTSDATKLGTLALNHAGTEADPVPTFSSDAAGTTVKLIYNPSTKDASKDGNNSKHDAIYKPAKAEVKASSGGSTYTMKVKEDNRNPVNEGTAITMQGFGGSASDVKGFVAKEDYEHAASSSNAKWGTGETVVTAGANDKVNAQQFTLTNTGNQATGELEYRFGSATANNAAGKYFSFVDGTLNLTNGLGASGAASNGDKGTFLVIPKTGLPYQAEAYTDTLVITNSNGFSVTVTLSFKVTADDMSLKVVTYLWNKTRQQALDTANAMADGTDKDAAIAAATAAAKMNLTAGNVVLVNTANGKTITMAANAGSSGEYTFTQYAANNKIAQDDSFYIKINGYTVTDTTTGLPKVVNKADPSVGVYLYEVTSAKYPTAGASAVPTLASSKSTSDGGITSTSGSIYVVYGETAKVEAQAAAASYTYKELQDNTVAGKDAPNGDKATSGMSYTTAPVTAPKAYTAIYTQGYTLTYQPNGADVKVGTTTKIDAEAVSSGHEPTDTVIAADPADLTTTKESTTYTGWTRAGYTFDHWNTSADDSGTSFAIGAGVKLDDYDVSGTVTLYAIWRSATELDLKGDTITVAYKEAIDKSFEATGGQSGKEYTAKNGSTDVNTNANAVADIKFVDGGNSGGNAEKFSFTGTSNDKPTGTDTEKTTTITVTVTDGNGDTKSADYTINQVKADTEIKKGFEDGVIAGTESNPAPKAGDDFDFTKLKAPNDMEVIAKKANGDPNTAVDFAETPADKDGNVTHVDGKEDGKWSLTAIDGKPIGTGDGEEPAKFKEGEHTYTLTYTPADPGFKPSTQTITIDLAKKINKVVVSLTFPVAKEEPKTDITNTNNTFLNDDDVVPTASSPDAKKTDAIVESVSWPSGVDTSGKFDRSMDITVFVKVTPKTADGWKFDTENFTAEFSNVTVDPDSTKTTDNIPGTGADKVTVISVTDTDAVLQYTWKAEDQAPTAIRTQVTAPNAGDKPDPSGIALGDPAGSFTTNSDVKWYAGAISAVTAESYAKTGEGALTYMDTSEGSTAKFVANNKYVAIVTCDVSKGWKFDTDIFAAADGKNDKALINGQQAKILKKTDAQVVIAYEFTASASKDVGLNSGKGPLVYYAKTPTHTANTATGHSTAKKADNTTLVYDFTLTRSDFTVTKLNALGTNSTITSGFGIYVDLNGNGACDAGELLVHDGQASYDFTNIGNANAYDTAKGTALDGKALYAVLTDASNNAISGASNQTHIGTLVVKELRADKIAKTAGTPVLSYADNAKKFNQGSTVVKAKVDFNTGMPMANSVADMTYAADVATGDNATRGATTFFYEMGDADASTFVAHGATGAVADNALLATKLVPGTTDVVNGKTLYMTYIDKNNNVVRTPVGIFSINGALSVTITDENGPDPEYGDKLTAEPVGGKPKPDGTYDYVWQKWVPDDTKPVAPDAPTPGDKGTWEPIPTDPEQPGGAKETGKTHTPGKDEVDEYIRVTVTDGDSNTVSSDPELIKPRSLNFTVKPYNKNYDRDDDNEHEYVVANEDGSLDFTPTMVMKKYKNNAFEATTPYGGVVNGDEVKIGPSATANAEGGWNSAETTRPAYATADVGAEITWPQVLPTAAGGKHATTDAYYALSGAGYQVNKGTDDDPVMVAVYRLAPQDSQAHCGVIMGGAGDIIHVDVSFDEIPVEYHTIPVKPMGVTDSRETRPGESETTGADTTQSYKATWYTGKTFTSADDNPFAAFDPTGNALPTGVTKVDTTTAPVFMPNKSYTVVVQVKPQPGKFYTLDSEAHSGDTQFFFHFGSKDSKKSVEVHSLAADPTRTDGIEVFKGLKVKSAEGKDDVYYMWYTFAVPDSGWVLPPHETNPWPDNMDFGTPVYYAQTAGHDTVNTTADNDPTPGGKKDVKFQFDLVSSFVTPINTAATPVEGTDYKPYQLTTDGTSTVTLTEDNYGTFWRLVAGTSTVTAKDNFLDNLTGWNDTTTTLAGKTFQDSNTNLTTQTAANADSVKLGDANIYVQINDKVGTVISTPLTTLNVRELTAESITATKTDNDKPVHLSYTAGDKFDVTTAVAATLDYTNVTGANVDFKALRDGQKVSTYTTTTVVDGIAKGTGSQYFFQYKTLDGDGNVKFVDLKSGADGTELTVAAHNGKPLYICYNDVNSDKSGTDEHTVRTRLGTLAVTEPGETPDSTAAVYIRNNTRDIKDTQYGDELEAVVVGVSADDAAAVSVKWQRLKKNATDETADASWEDIGHTDKKYLASKDDVLTKVRAVITAHTGHNVPAYPNSDSVEVAKKQLAVTWTWTPGSKVYDGNATAATDNGKSGSDKVEYYTHTALNLTHGQGETVNDEFTLTDVTGAVFANTATAPADNSADVGYNKPITLTGGAIPTGGGKINGGAANATNGGKDNPATGDDAEDWNQWYELVPDGPTGAITKLALEWSDFTFTGKVKRYDGTDHVYSKDNFNLTVENTAVADNVDLSTANGADKDSGLWTLKNPETDGVKKFTDDLYAILTGAIKATNVRYTTANSLEPRGVPVDAEVKKPNGHSTIILELSTTSNNIQLPTGAHYVKDADGKTNSAINPKQVTVGPQTTQVANGVLTRPTISKTATTVTLPGTVQTAQVVTNDPTVNFTVLGKVEPHAENATTAAVTVLDVVEDTSNGIYWSDNNYALIWKNGDPVECPITGGEIEAITDVTIAQVVYGDGLSSVKVTAKVKYKGIDAPESTSDYTFATLANLGIKAIVEHDTNGDPTTMEYALADGANTKAGWDDGADANIGIAVRFFLAGNVDADHLDTTTFADDGNKKLGTGTVTVLPRKLNVTPKWNLDENPKIGKFYDGTPNALGTLKDATDATLVATETGSMTFTYDNWAFDADKTKVAVNTSTDDGYNAAFADKDAGDDKPITVTLVTDAPFTGDLSNRYEKGEVKLAEGNIKKRPVTITMTKPSVVQYSPVTTALNEKFTYDATKNPNIVSGDTIQVGISVTYLAKNGVATGETATAWDETTNNFDKTDLVGEFTKNVTWTDAVYSSDAANYDITLTVPGGDVTATKDKDALSLWINYYTPAKETAPQNAKNFGGVDRVNVPDHGAANGTNWYPADDHDDFTTTGATAMDFDNDEFDQKHYYMVESVFVPENGTTLSANTEITVDGILKVKPSETKTTDNYGTPDKGGLLSAKATLNTGTGGAKDTITVQAIYYVPADEPAQVELVHITYPEPEANAAPNVVKGTGDSKTDTWTWLNLADSTKVDVDEDPADPVPAAGSKKTKGTTWYKTNRDKPTAVADFEPTVTGKDNMTKQNGVETFDDDAYYMVEGIIEPKKTPAPGYVFASAVNVVVNDITVTVSDAGSVVPNADDTGWAMAKWETKTVVDNNGTPDDTTDDTTSTVKTGNVIVRYIAKTAPAETKVIDRVLGKVSEPTLNGRIGKTVSETQAYFENGNDATARVDYSAVKWYRTADPTAAYTEINTDTETAFKAGQYYKAVFTVKTTEDYKFLYPAMDADHVDNTKYVAFKINEIPDSTDFKTWINRNRADDTRVDTATASDITVTTEQTDGNYHEYTITVTFPMIDAKEKLDVEGFTVPKAPKAGDAISNANITAKAGQPYEIETVDGEANRSWQHWNGTGWEPTADANFKAGHFYRAELTVKIKDAVDANGEKMTNLYKFTETTNGFVNGGKANGVPDGEKPDVNELDTNIRYNKTGDEVTTVTLFKEFYVKREAVEARLYAREPKAGDWAYLIEDDIKIHASHKDNHYADTRYTLSDQGDTEPAAQWYYKADNGSYVLMDHDVPFQEGGTYFLITDAKTLEGYCFADSLSSYKWFDSPAADAAARQDAALYVQGPNKVEGEVTSSRVAFKFELPPPNYINVIPGNAKQPVYDQPLDDTGWTSENFNVVGKVIWYEGEKKIGDIDSSTPVDYTNAKEETVYTAAITVKPKDGVTIDPDTSKLIYTFNGEICETNEYRANPDGTYTLVHTFPPTGKKEVIHDGTGGGGGGTTTVESPVVYYHLKDQGVTDDPTAEKVRKNSKPTKVPKVKAITGLKFLGWSEVDPGTLPAGKLPTLVDPTTFKITADKWFYAVYEQGPEVDHLHYVIGFPNGTFGPDAKITRAEVATIIARSCLEGFVEGANYGNPGNYSDVTAHWAFSAIAFCAREGVFKGYEDGTFRPDRYITRQELATVVARLAGIQTSQGVPFNDRNQIASWAMNGVYTAYANGWIKGYEDGTFQPERDISRAETVKIFNGYLKRGVDAKGLEGLKEYVHTGVASNNTENGHDEYMTWPDVPKTHWAYHEIIEAANDHNYHWQDAEKKMPPEDWDEVYIEEKWRYNDNASDGADKRDENMNLQKTFTVTYLVSSNGVTYDAITETVDRFASPKPENMPVAVPNEGYRFAGWSSTDPSTGTITLVDPTASSVTSDEWFYAVFEEDKPYELPIYTVTYVIGDLGSYDGATVERVEMYQAPSVSGLPQPEVNEGYRFAGWSETDPATGSYTIVDPTANYVTGDKTFYAVYEKADEPYHLPVYTVTYVIGANGSYDGETVEQVEMYQAPSLDVYPHPVANEGYRFVGWSETDPATGSYSIMDPTANYVTGDKTFYAVYEEV